MMSLEEEVALHPETMEAVDALGRTPLIWAAARGNEHAVALLLGAGASPNALDTQWTNAVSYAAERDHVVCVRLLLEAGAEPDPGLPAGIKVGSGLNCATRNASKPLILKTLLDFGADVEASGIEGVTSLIHAARTDKVDFATILLEYGANINASSTLGQTPLTTAIAYNSHSVLSLLLDRWFEYSVCPRLQGPHLLQIAALYANIETLHILAKTNHIMLKYDHSFSRGDFATRLLERSDMTEKLVVAFEELIGIVERAPDSRHSTPNLLESGYLSRPTSLHELEKAMSDDASSDFQDSEQSFDDAVEHLPGDLHALSTQT